MPQNRTVREHLRAGATRSARNRRRCTAGLCARVTGGVQGSCPSLCVELQDVFKATRRQQSRIQLMSARDDDPLFQFRELR
jgi:hypothetical protein